MFRRLSPSALSLLALSALVLFFYRQAAFTNLIFARGDTFFYFYPYWDYRNAALLAGQLPLWNPYLFMGVPFLANSQAGVFYPFNWPLIFFTAPVAVKISIIAHVTLAAWGAYALARRAFELDPRPAFLTAAIFSLGGYLTAQVEHVNQLQGLAWLPFALLFTHHLTSSGPSHSLASLPLLSLTLALQLTAGHTQTAFITLVACGLVALYNLVIGHFTFEKQAADPQRVTRTGFWKLGGWGLGILLAFALAAIQLLPTLELSRLSLRGGGLPLNEAISFSLNPLLLGRALLLPTYNYTLYSEFVAYIGGVPLILVSLALTNVRRDRLVLLAALLAGLGLFFALGGYNPLYLLLARFVPGFNFFRVPARWLALWALGAALLAGYGLQKLLALTANDTEAERGYKRPLRQFAPYLIPILVLVSLAFLSAQTIPPGETGPIGFPQVSDLLIWLLPSLAAAYSILRQPRPALRNSILMFVFVEFFWAYPLPVTHLTTPAAYESIRPAMTQLLIHNTICNPRANICPPPARFLSLSQLEFDPGDLAELHSEWDRQLPAEAVYDAIIATKYKEVLSPNLPLTWGIPAVDGYDGGILPLRAYAEFAGQFGDVPPNTDGRLRQFLKTVPPNWLLNLTNTRWIITDKTGDAWIDSVFYDLGLTATVTSPAPLTLTRLPDFQATALGVVLGPDSQSGVAQITFDTGETATLPIAYDPAQPALRLGWDTPAVATQIVILTPNALTLRGLSLIDERTDSFQSITLGPYRLAHSGDVKIYENLNVLPRAFFTPDLQSDVRDPQPQIINYEAGQVSINSDTDLPGYVVLTDSNYPGWTAAVDGQPAVIETAYGLFRAVAVPAGAHTIEFRFESPALQQGAAISGLALLFWFALLGYALRRRAT